MGAALGATGDVKVLSGADMRRQRCSEPACLRMRFGAGGRAGAGNHAQQRVIRARHEVLVPRHLASRFGQYHAPGCHAQAGREIGEIAERFAPHLPEGKSDQRARCIEARARQDDGRLCLVLAKLTIGSILEALPLEGEAEEEDDD